MDFIIDNWTDIYIEILIYQNEQFRYIAENISKLKEKCNKKNIPIFDDKTVTISILDKRLPNLKENPEYFYERTGLPITATLKDGNIIYIKRRITKA